MNIHDAFDDAHRRVCIAKARGNTDRNNIWAGLAFPSEMKRMKEEGFMIPLGKEISKVLNWYIFTEKGWKEYDKRYEGKPDWFAIK